MAETTCQNCGKVFLVKPSRIKYGYGKYCSKECGYAKLSENRTEQYKRTCERCGKVFYATKSQIEKGAKYCSRECHHPKHERNCEVCGKLFRYSPSTNQRFCTTKCLNSSEYKKIISRKSHHQMMSDPKKRKRWMDGIKRRSSDPNWLNSEHFQKGKDHPRHKGNKRTNLERFRYKYKKWKADVLKKDNYTCQQCKKRGGRLVAHHIKEWAKFPKLRFDIDNGQTLCHECHCIIHGKEPKPLTRNCKGCGKRFTLKRYVQKFCTRQCFLDFVRK